MKEKRNEWKVHVTLYYRKLSMTKDNNADDYKDDDETRTAGRRR